MMSWANRLALSIAVAAGTLSFPALAQANEFAWFCKAKYNSFVFSLDAAFSVFMGYRYQCDLEIGTTSHIYTCVREDRGTHFLTLTLEGPAPKAGIATISAASTGGGNENTSWIEEYYCTPVKDLPGTLEE